jgi:phosphoribosylanthranilate isomerase
MKIKLCGFTKKESLQVAIAEKCDFLGFVFCEKSPRYITPQDASSLASLVPSTIKKVAVIVDAPFSLLEEIVTNIEPNFFQFHGTENIAYLEKVRKTFPNVGIIKTFKIKSVEDLDAVKDFENYVDFFLFDSSSGGSGKQFDWKILQNFSSKKIGFLLAE